MSKKWFILLSLLTAIVLAIIGVFIGAQFRDPEYEPRFRLTENSNTLKTNSKEVLDMKSNLMSSIAKNCRGNLKGPIPESLEFDLSKITDEGAKSLIKVFDVSLVEITNFKGYTYVLKETLPISKYTYHHEVQTGLLTNVPMEALLTYFRNDKLYERPVMVCPVISIDDKDFDCYLRSSDNEWSTFDFINGLDPSDAEFDKKITEFIDDHYKKLSSQTEKTTEEETVETKSEEQTHQEQPKQDIENYESLELDLSKKQDFTNDLVEFSEINKYNIPGFKGYAHRFKRKLSVSKFEYNGTEQEGLPTNRPIDAVLTFFHQDNPYSDPFVTCTITSLMGKKFDCYLRNSENEWSKNDKISELNHRDSEFGEKFAKIVNDHYYQPESTSEKYSWDQNLSNDTYKSTTDLPSESGYETSSSDKSSEYYYDSDNREANKDEQYTGESNDEQLRHELEQNKETTEEETVETKSEEQTHQEQPKQYIENQNDQIESSNEQENQVSDKIEINLADNTTKEEFINISEIQDLEVPGYKGYSHIFMEPAKVNSYKYNDQSQYGLPSNTNLDGLLVFFKNDRLDDLPMAVCTIKSLDDMDFDCYLRNPENEWSKNDQLSGLDITNEDFGVDASSIVDQHYIANN